MAGERFNREAGKPWLAEAPPADSPVETELETSEFETEFETSELRTRLERQAAESGRLDGRVQTLERALKAERDARRRLGETLQRERRAAEALHERAEREQAAHAAAAKEIERLRHVTTMAEQQTQLVWVQLREAERELAWNQRTLWRKLLRRPPAH